LQNYLADQGNFDVVAATQILICCILRGLMDQRADTSSIMVIGSDSHFCYLMRRYVSESFHNVIFAYLGDDALALAQKEIPAAIILEVDQPDTRGWDLLKTLKANLNTQNIPVVLCSWLDDDQRGIEEGADACLRKPILFSDFKRVLSLIGIESCQ
jgi:CheY-like chemotaxis protein